MDVTFWYIENIILEFPHVHFRYFVKPTEYLKGTALSFGQDLLQSRIALGKSDALHIIYDNGPQGNGAAGFREELKVELNN